MPATLRVRPADVTIGSMSKLSPRVDRPAIPAEYGVTKASRFVDWAHIEERFAADRVYWIATVGRDGRPRVRPIDGVYVDGAIYVGGSPETRWVRELADNPHVNVRLAEASNAKFPEYRMTAAVYRSRGAIAIRPRKVISWTDITADPTRFRFER